MSKLKQLKEAMKNPPPERLARVEYRSHFMQMLGITIVCLILIIKGYWYVIFAFVFGLGVSYASGMTAYKKYQVISALIGKPNPVDFEKDISPTRRKGKIINHVLGSSPKWASIICSVIISMMIIPPDIPRLALTFAYLISIGLFFTLFYYFMFYWITYPIYKKEMTVNEPKKNTRTKRR